MFFRTLPRHIVTNFNPSRPTISVQYPVQSSIRRTPFLAPQSCKSFSTKQNTTCHSQCSTFSLVPKSVDLASPVQRHPNLRPLGHKFAIIKGKTTTKTALSVGLVAASVPALATTPSPPSIFPQAPDSSLQQSPFEEQLDDIETVDQFYATFQGVDPETLFPQLPVLTLDEVKSVSRLTSPTQDDGKRVIIIQGDYIYDVTTFIEVHPGGDRILQANFDSADPFWLLYPIHRESAIVWQVLQEYRIGILAKPDREEYAARLKVLEENAKKNNMWKYEPDRSSKVLRFLTTTPCNAETPLHLIPNAFLTPSEYFFIRNHHPNPVTFQPAPERGQHELGLVVNEAGITTDPMTKTLFLPIDERHKYPIAFEIDQQLYESGLYQGKEVIHLSLLNHDDQDTRNGTGDSVNKTKELRLKLNKESGKYEVSLTIGDLEQLVQQHDVTSTIICSGNRRNEMNVQTKLKTDGLSWGSGALSTGQFRGFKLSDIYGSLFGIDYLSIQPAQQPQPQHCVLRALDAPFDTSLPLPRALDPRCDVMLAIGMNGAPLEVDQGYPIKLIAPGLTGNRQVKAVSSIHIGSAEAQSAWHMSTPYRHTGPATQPNRPPQESPQVYFWPVFSSITSPIHNEKSNANQSAETKGDEINPQDTSGQTTEPTLNPSQELSPTAISVTPHRCRDPTTLGSIKAQLLRQPSLVLGSGHDKFNTDQELEDGISSFRCIDLSGYAYVGNGIGISRVDTAVVGSMVAEGDEDEDENNEKVQQDALNPISPTSMVWTEAVLQRNADNTPSLPNSTTIVMNNHWAWVLWKSEVVIPNHLGPDQTVIVSSKAVDYMGNSQPQHIQPMWNSRGILDNAWCQYPVKIEKQRV